LLEITLYHADAVEKLRQLPDNSVDSLIVDPPYGLSDFDVEHIIACLKKWLNGEAYSHKSKGFMGADWDHWVPGPELWREVIRVLKPGAFSAVFAGTRTVDLMGISLRLGGFDVCDELMWIRGQGFPHGPNVGKLLDAHFGATREVVAYDASRARPNRLYESGAMGNIGGNGKVSDRTDNGATITAPATREAAQWEGFSTELKGMHEPILLVQKPFKGKIVDNILRWGVGALNINACRVQRADPVTNHSRSEAAAVTKGIYGSSKVQETHQTNGQKLGSFPTNVVLTHDYRCKIVGVSASNYKINAFTDGAKPFGDAKGEAYETTEMKKEVDVYECVDCCPVGLLDQQSGILRSGVGAIKRKSAKENKGNVGSVCGKESRPEGTEMVSFGDEGGASRFYNNLPWSEDDIIPFFYAQRVAPKERDAGLIPAEGEERANKHPTVKPLSLIRWLSKLLTPPGGVILDCCAGSGTTGAAAALEGFDAILIEREAEYIPVIQGRVKYHGGTVLTPDIQPVIGTERIPMYVKHVHSNLKSGANYNLGPRTLIIGANGSGKSAIVGAVELALAGFVSDITGHDRVKAGIELLTLAPSDEDLWSKVEVADTRGGDEITFFASTSIERNRSTGGAKSPVRVAPIMEVRFPVFDIEEALSGKPETARNWLLSQAGGYVTEEEILSSFFGKNKVFYSQFSAGLKGDPVSRLLTLKETIQAKALSLGKEASGAEKLARSAGTDLMPCPTEEAIDNLKLDLADAQKELWTFSQAAKNDVTRALTLRDAAYDRWVSLYNECDAAARAEETAKQQAAEFPVDQNISVADQAIAMIDATQKLGFEYCLVCCSTDMSHLASQRQSLKDYTTAGATARQYALLANTASTRVQQLLRSVQSAEATHSAAQAAYDAALAAPQAEGDGIDLATDVADITAELTKAQNARAQWAVVAQQRMKAEELRAEADEFSAFAAAIKQAVTDTVTRLREEFIKRVQSFLPEQDVFDLQLFDGDRAVSRFGFIRNGQLHTALSGAEWARLTLALAAAVAKEGEINIIVPEDRSFDSRTLTEVLYALSLSPDQIIFCTPTEPEAIPDSWTVIRLGKEGKKAAEKKLWSADAADFPDITGAFCAECRGPIRNTPSGTICPEGHGGAPLVDAQGNEFLGVIPEYKKRRKRRSDAKDAA
jgi:site-specific DNA-methyltransferase (adenine-specific)